MTKEEKLSKIYEVIADKTLSFGCIVELNVDPTRSTVVNRYIDITYCEYEQEREYKNIWDSIYHNTYTRNEYEIYRVIWHPIMIGDVLDWMHENTPDHEDRNLVFNYRKLLREPIDSQSDDCIDFVYDLIVQHG